MNCVESRLQAFSRAAKHVSIHRLSFTVHEAKTLFHCFDLAYSSKLVAYASLRQSLARVLQTSGSDMSATNVWKSSAG